MSKISSMRFVRFSQKQKQVLTWWTDKSPVKHANGIICDGAIRSGKTVCMGLSFVMWAMHRFDGQNFALCGKTIGSLRRNMVLSLACVLRGRGYTVIEHRADNMITVSRGNVSNDFYLFGGRDERSQDLIQGITLAGVLLDEVALMPESFVNQATARCSVDGSTWWFNCNPEGPYHWFYTSWILNHKDNDLLHIHFTMDDNNSLSEDIKARYRKRYSGVFYDRYILGLWKVAEGLIYDMFDETVHVVPEADREYTRYYISMDYGTQNPTAMLLWGLFDGIWYCIGEYYYSGREQQKQKTDEEFFDDLEKLAGDHPIKAVIIDPSAASMIACIRKRGRFSVIPADNSVLDGIRNTATALNGRRILFSRRCKNTLREFCSYVWDSKAADRGEDKPVKEHDHAMDAVRYFVQTVVSKKRDAGMVVNVLNRR